MTRKGVTMETLTEQYDRVRMTGCRVVGVTLNAVKGTARITLERALDDEMVNVYGALGFWARQELVLDADIRQQQAPLPLRTDLTTKPTPEVQEALDKMPPVPVFFTAENDPGNEPPPAPDG
jgi:hypothetical protein